MIESVALPCVLLRGILIELSITIVNVDFFLFPLKKKECCQKYNIFVVERSHRRGSQVIPRFWLATAITAKVHEMRCIGASLGFKNFVVQQVMRPSTWFCKSKYTCFYLRDVTQRPFDTFSLDHVVDAELVTPST